MPLERLTPSQESAAATIDPAAAQQYLRCTGWRLEPRLGRGITAVWERPEADQNQIQIPLAHDLADFAPVMGLAVSGIAGWERRPAVEVLDELVNFPADLFRVQLAGGLDVGEAAALLDAVRTAGPCRVIASLSPGWALTVAFPTDPSRGAVAVMEALRRRGCAFDNGSPAEHVQVRAQWSQALPPPEDVPDVVVLRREDLHRVAPERPTPAVAR